MALVYTLLESNALPSEGHGIDVSQELVIIEGLTGNVSSSSLEAVT